MLPGNRWDVLSRAGPEGGTTHWAGYGLVTPPQGSERCQVGIPKGDTSCLSPMSIVYGDWELSGQGMEGSCVGRVPAPYTANIPEEIGTRWRSSQYLQELPSLCFFSVSVWPLWGLEGP